MKNKKLYLYSLLLFTLIIFALSGCSKAPVTSVEQPNLRRKKLNMDYYKSADSFWKMAYEEIPTVSYEEIISGDYNNTYVCIDMIGVYSEESKLNLDNWKEIEVEMAVPRENGGYYSYDESVIAAANYMFKFGYDELVNLKQGDKIKMCFYVKLSDLTQSYAVAAKKIGTDNTFDISLYKENMSAQAQSESEKERLESEIDAERESEQQKKLEQKQTKTEAVKTLAAGHRDETLNGRGYSDSGRNEPIYTNVIGYVAVSSSEERMIERSDDFENKALWMVPTYEKDKQFWNETGSIPHKTEVIVISQELEHEGWGGYSGHLLVERTDDHSQYYIDVSNFITKPYWTYTDVREAVKVGDCIAEYHQNSNYWPVDSGGNKLEIADGTKVLVSGVTGTGTAVDKNQTDIEAIVWKEWKLGYDGVSCYFNHEDLNIIY